MPLLSFETEEDLFMLNEWSLSRCSILDSSFIIMLIVEELEETECALLSNKLLHYQ